jgi:hypothetical protein
LTWAEAEACEDRHIQDAVAAAEQAETERRAAESAAAAAAAASEKAAAEAARVAAETAAAEAAARAAEAAERVEAERLAAEKAARIAAQNAQMPVGAVMVAVADFVPQPDDTGHHLHQVAIAKGNIVQRVEPFPGHPLDEEDSEGWTYVVIRTGARESQSYMLAFAQVRVNRSLACLHSHRCA